MPFFDRIETLEFIRDVAQSRKLLLYIGAGVTIDSSGLTWEGLVRKLAERASIDEDSVRRMFGGLTPVQVASIVAAKYNEKWGDSRFEARLISDIRSELYNDHLWREGQYAMSVAILCASLARSGVDVTVVTTNYDEHLEASYNSLVANQFGKAPFEFAPSTLSRERDVPEEQVDDDEFEVSASEASLVPVVSLIHIHGFIPQDSFDSKMEFAVFSERNYIDSEGVVQDFLEPLMKDSNVLILGSSLDDPPLIRSLALSADTKRSRWAVIPRQGLPRNSEPYTVPILEDSNIANILQRRADQLGLRIVVPDFFSQASQLPREIARLLDDATSTAPDDLKVAEARSYKRRLDTWWAAWSKGNSVRFEENQQRAHAYLNERIAEIRDITGRSDEGLKLELWVRWKPDSRCLRLWASSTGTWRDERTMRQCPIDADSVYTPVKAFCFGTSRIVETAALSERWKRYLGVPIRIAADTASSVMVGVVTLGTNEIKGSRISYDRPDTLQALRETMEKIGSDLLTPSP
ncbi:SIR2 family protein [Rhodococcus ruber]|uniref:SIR2 family protein n=1 Tax=Rhodococcus ruber TaxID=1830 RepID=UPI0015585D16|nr:SIR2 family protein [Rhodococcus ruber]